MGKMRLINPKLQGSILNINTYHRKFENKQNNCKIKKIKIKEAKL